MKKRIRFKNPAIGVHIDGEMLCPHGVRIPGCRHLSTYIQEIEDMALRYQTSTAFVVTDSKYAMQELSNINGITFIHTGNFMKPGSFSTFPSDREVRKWHAITSFYVNESID